MFSDEESEEKCLEFLTKWLPLCFYKLMNDEACRDWKLDIYVKFYFIFLQNLTKNLKKLAYSVGKC